MQLRREAKLSTVIVLITYRLSHYIDIISNTFVTHDYFSELIRTISLFIFNLTFNDHKFKVNVFFFYSSTLIPLLMYV